MNQPTGAIHYRVWQFFRALTARVSQGDLETVACMLTPAPLALFRAMAIQDQRHGLDVYAALRKAGHTNPDLLAAALLHDVGKAVARLPAWQRAIIVLLDHFAPRLLARLSQGDPTGWRRPFVVYAQHPEAGACWAQEAGCSPLTVALIRRHEDRIEDCQIGNCQTEEDHLLAALQIADSLN
jgi:hypothetical protein